MATIKMSAFWCFTIQYDDDNHNWDPNDVYNNPKLPIPSYCVAQLERAPTTGQLHWQGYVEFKNRILMRTCKTVLKCEWAHLEPRKGTAEEAIAYCKKPESRVEDFDQFEKGEPKVSEIITDKSKSNYKRALEADSYDEAIRILRETEPRDYVLYNSSISKTLEKEFSSEEIYEQLNFNVEPIGAHITDKLSVILTGSTGLGKTQYAISHFKNPLILSHIDDLKRFSTKHDGMVFDDMSFGHWPAESCIHLVDLEHRRSINVKHGTATIPKGTRRFFTTNSAFYEVFSSNKNREHELAIERRCHVVNVTEKLFD